MYKYSPLIHKSAYTKQKHLHTQYIIIMLGFPQSQYCKSADLIFHTDYDLDLCELLKNKNNRFIITLLRQI